MKISLGEIAKIVGGKVVGDSDKMITGVAPFEDAGSDQITFAGNAKFLKKINETKAGAILTSPETTCDSKNLVVVEKPKVAFITILPHFNPPAKREGFISQDARVGDNFICGEDVTIHHFVTISDNVTIGDRVVLFPGVFIGENAKLGDDVVISPNVTIYDHCQIGNRVLIHAGTVIGSDGFGFVPDGEIYHKIPQTGIVQIDDDVEIGALNAIDRATFGKTWLKNGVKTDNLVHIAHNVTVGENCVLAGMVGLAGSVNVGKHVVMAGQVGVGDHLTIGDNAIIGPQAGVAKSVPEGTVVSGTPEMPHRSWLKVSRILPKLPELKRKIADLEKRLLKIEDEQD